MGSEGMTVGGSARPGCAVAGTTTGYAFVVQCFAGNLRLIPDGPSGEDVGAGCLHNLPHFTDGYFTGARLLDDGRRSCG
eukprot:scaffold120922_cov66-Phaeocystis_antarctica.AAC.2